MLVVDYSFDRPQPSALAAAGVKGAMRYLSHNPAKDVHAPELAALHGAGLAVGFVWELTADRALAGAGAGNADVNEANRRMDELGVPIDRPCFFAVDFDVQPGQRAAVRSYFAAMLRAPRPRGIYGPAQLVDAFMLDGLAAYGWSAAGWHHGHTSALAQLRQGGTLHVDDVNVDANEATRPDYGAWAPPVAPPAPQEPALTDLTISVPVLARGDHGPDVEHLQRLLNRATGTHLAVDGRYGPATEEAVRNVERVGGLPLAGIVDGPTWRVLILAAGVPLR